MKVNQYFLLFVVFLLGILFSHIIGGDLIEGKKSESRLKNKKNNLQQCNDGATRDRDTRECVCPDAVGGATYDNSKGKCVCLDGKTYDKYDKRCECSGGSYTLNDRSCTCGGGARYDKGTGSCICPDGTRLQTKDHYYTHCPCPSGKTYNDSTWKCE